MTTRDPSPARAALAPLGLAAVLALAGGCSSTYVTPGAGVRPAALAGTADASIAEVLEREPAAAFPCRLAVARVQSSGYHSRTLRSAGRGAYSVVTTRDVETDEHLARLAALPAVVDVGALNRLVIPARLESLQDLRAAAATLRTDVLLVYSIDTGFRVDDQDIGPLGLLTLGFAPNQEAHVTSTASAAFVDVRTGFLYGLAEATATAERRGNAWNTRDAVDDARLTAEAEAFDALVDEVALAWDGVLRAHAPDHAPDAG